MSADASLLILNCPLDNYSDFETGEEPEVLQRQDNLKICKGKSSHPHGPMDPLKAQGGDHSG
jgi:hypothetical protein